jgi:hypothetical protein
MSEYPHFLIHMLQKSNRIKIKEACCRKIVKIFGERKKVQANSKTPGGATAGGTRDGNPEDHYKVEFINLVEPLIDTMKTSNFNLTSIAASALVNLCNFSEDIKDIFMQKKGANAILEYLTCKEEDTLINVLRLFFCLIARSETIGKQLADENNNEAIHSLLKIILGPSIADTKYSLDVTYFSI